MQSEITNGLFGKYNSLTQKGVALFVFLELDTNC